MSAIIWGMKIVFGIFVIGLAISIGIAGLLFVPGIALIYGGINVGGILGGSMVVLGLLACCTVFGLFAAAK